MDSYKREVAFRAIASKYCPYCATRKWNRPSCFCPTCEGKLTVGVLKGLRNRQSFAWAYYKALDVLRELAAQEKNKNVNG